VPSSTFNEWGRASFFSRNTKESSVCIRKSRRNTSHLETPKRQSKIKELRRNKEEKKKKSSHTTNGKGRSVISKDCLLENELKGKFYRMAIRPAMLYGAEC
jgi:hypothetical protein